MPHLVSIRIQDSGGATRAMTIPVDEDTLLNDISAFALQIGNALDDCTGGRVVGASVTYELDMSAVVTKAAALDDVPVWVSGRLGFSVTGSQYRTSLVIPAVHPGIADNNDVIADAGDAATLIAALLGGLNATVQDKYGNNLAAFLGGKRVSRK